MQYYYIEHMFYIMEGCKWELLVQLSVQSQGARNGCRILYSNDGLIFASFDHYATFYEIA